MSVDARFELFHLDIYIFFNRDIFIYRVCDLYFTGTVIMSVDARFELFHLDIYIFFAQLGNSILNNAKF